MQGDVTTPAQAIANALPTLSHPGDDTTPPMALPTPFRATGMPDEQAAEFIGATTRLWAEAIVHVLEGEFEIIRKTDAAQLRQDAAEAPDGTRIVNLHIGAESNPAVLQLVIGKTDHVVIPEAAWKALQPKADT